MSKDHHRPYRRCKSCKKVFQETEMRIVIQLPQNLEQCPLCGATEGFYKKKGKR